MAKPERYQLAFDFGQRQELSTVRYELSGRWQDMAEQQGELGRFTRVVRDEVIVRSPVVAAHHLLSNIYTPFAAFDQEEFWVLLMNHRQRVTHEVMVYRGTVGSLHIRIAELFKDAVRVNAPALLLSHVHPSGAPRSA